jgi:hypothetical protein
MKIINWINKPRNDGIKLTILALVIFIAVCIILHFILPKHITETRYYL